MIFLLLFIEYVSYYFCPYTSTRCLTLSEGLVNGVAILSQGLNKYSNIMFSINITGIWAIFLDAHQETQNQPFLVVMATWWLPRKQVPQDFFPDPSPTFRLTIQYHKWNIWAVKTLFACDSNCCRGNQNLIIFSAMRALRPTFMPNLMEIGLQTTEKQRDHHLLCIILIYKAGSFRNRSPFIWDIPEL